MHNPTTIIIDTETTGLDCTVDEILQLSIIDDSKNVLYDGYFKPNSTSWESAQEINHISPEMVKDAPPLIEKIDMLNEIIGSTDKIVGYNTIFDLGFLKQGGIHVPENAIIIDVMRLFASIYGEYSDYFGGYKWQKLTTCATYYGYDWSSHEKNAHNSLADCFATLYCYNKMLDGVHV